MTSATQTGPFWGRADKTKTATGPERKPRGGPVFIGDAVTPWGADTLLLAVLRTAQRDISDDE
ncbi:hypothetical protein [Thalassococcus sp. S3]|uniref:hypothetical protein n=1 Tax=Thalassococcus sp. S3 TaxID=2017482 RepID=UPI0010242EFF|nr:hypothetical protein [Thalassococcus sp. S3]QBF33138.1 hypothetical protein CFI11_18185 [Thalassococcus sp. S3]